MMTNPIPGHLPKRNKNICSHKKLYANVYSDFIQKSPQTGNNPNALQLMNE